MKKSVWAKAFAVAAARLVLFALPAAAGSVNGAQSAATAQQPDRRIAIQASPQRGPVSIENILAGLTLTDDQKAKIARIRQDMKAHMDLVAKDNRNTQDQKQAMLEGLERMERRQVFQALTAKQREEVRKRIMAQREIEQERNKPLPASLPR